MSFKITCQSAGALTVALVMTVPVCAKTIAMKHWDHQTMVLKLTSPKTEYFAQDAVIVDVHMISHLNKRVYINEDRTLLDGGNFAVTYADGKPVPLTAYGKSPVPRPNLRGLGGFALPTRFFGLDPGREAVYHVWLNRVFDLSLEGSYIINVGKYLPTSGEQTAPQDAVSSNPLKITINSPNDIPYSARLGPDIVPIIHYPPVPGQVSVKF